MEELYGIVGRITNSLIVKFRERDAAFRAVKQIIETKRERDLDVGERKGKRKRAHDPKISVMGEELDVANLSTRGQRDHVMHIKDGGTHKHVHC